MTMGHISVLILWICLNNVKCNEDQVFAIKGCNATLEWRLGNSSFVDHLIDIQVLNASDFIMAWTEGDSCVEANGVSVYCEKRKRGENWLLYVVLIYVTPVHSGKYTCRVEYGIGEELTFAKELMVIDKPHILKSPQAILNRPLNVTCTVDDHFKGVKYHWKLNGTDLHSTGRIYAKSSILRFDSVWTVDKSSNFACEVCQQNSCCIESETFALEPYHGPDTVALGPNQREFYLHENEAFTVKCSADCNPICSVWWEGYINSNNEVLVISSFDSRMAGTYICKTKNLKTDMTAFETISLHHAKVSSTVVSSDVQHTEVFSTVASSNEHTEDPDLNVLGTGLVIVAVGLVIIGFSILVMLRHKYISRKPDSQTLHHPLEGPANGKVSRELFRLEKQDRPLPFPPVQDNAYRKIRRSGNPDGHRNSRSLQTLLDHTKDFWNPVRQSLSMQTLVQLSHKAGRRSKSDDSLSKMCYSKKYSRSSMEELANRVKLDEPYSKFRKDRKVCNDEQTNSAKTLGLSLNNPLPESFDQQSQEDLYSSIDEAAFPVNNVARVNEKEENLQEDHKKTEAGNYEYDYATLPAL